MAKLRFAPSLSSYATRPGSPVVGTELDGGMGAYRQDILNPADKVSCQWVLRSKTEYQQFVIFYKGPAKEGAAVFLMDLVIDDPDPVERTCRFLPGTFSLDSIQGNVHIVSAQLEVEPIYYDPAYWDTLQMLVESYGDLETASPVLNQLEILINVDFPEYLWFPVVTLDPPANFEVEYLNEV
jgi:hypothetical protein